MSVKSVLSRVGLAAVLLFVVGFWAYPAVRAKAAPKTRKQVRFWHMWTAEWKDVVDKIVARYNASQDEYEVVALSVPSSGADAKFLTGVMGGDPPDVMAQWNPIIPVWAEGGLITPLDELMSPREKATFDAEAYPVAKRIGEYRGRVYGMPMGINMTGLFYLPKELRAAGIDEKAAFSSLEALDAAGARLNRFDKAHGLTHLGFMPTGFSGFANLFGGGIWDGTRVTIDTPANLRALEYLVAVRKRVGYEQVVRYNSGLNTASSAAGWPFVDGAWSVAVDGQWRVEQLGKYAKGFEYKTAPIPPPKGGKARAWLSNGNFMIVPRGSRERAGAWSFIKFWSGLDHPEVAAEFYTLGGWLPLTPAVAGSPIYRKYVADHPQFQTFVDLMSSKEIQVLPPVPYQQFLGDEIAKMEDRAARGTVSPAQALRELAAKLDAELRRRKALGE